MFQITGTRFLLFVLIAASLGALWFLDTGFNGTQILPNILTNSGIVKIWENVPEPTKNDTFKSKEFVPTNEWQIIEEDQPVPAGLHLRINLQSGEKMAKLIDKNTDGETNSLAISHSNMSDNIENSKNPSDSLHKFKSYQQLKDDLKELNMDVKSDMEIMHELSTKFQEQIKVYNESDQNLQNILTDLEYLLHQVDTAQVFVKNKGIELIIIPCLNSTSSFMKAQGALLLGSAASNNQVVQIAALKTNIIPLLLKHISDEYEFSVQKNCFFALSSITRRFPTALKQVIESQGIQTFMSVFKRSKSDFNTKLKVKISQLLEDLVLEIEDAQLTLKEETNGKLSSEAKERVRQYDELKLKEKLVENDWCKILSDEFITLSNPLPSNEESHQMVEASGKSLLAMSEQCKAKLQGNQQLFNSLNALETYYKTLFLKDDFYNPLYQLTNELANTYDPVLE